LRSMAHLFSKTPRRFFPPISNVPSFTPPLSEASLP
jgi:hypothetical protein